VFSTACSSASITSIVSKWQPLFYLQSRKQRNVIGGQARSVGWLGDDNHVVYGKEFHGEKESESWCIVASSFIAKVQGKVFAHFHALTIKRHSSMWN
jgi:hypothetical protein